MSHVTTFNMSAALNPGFPRAIGDQLYTFPRVRALPSRALITSFEASITKSSKLEV